MRGAVGWRRHPRRLRAREARLQEIAGDCRRLQEIARDCRRLQEIAGDCRRLQEIAGCMTPRPLPDPRLVSAPTPLILSLALSSRGGQTSPCNLLQSPAISCNLLQSQAVGHRRRLRRDKQRRGQRPRLPLLRRQRRPARARSRRRQGPAGSRRVRRARRRADAVGRGGGRGHLRLPARAACLETLDVPT